MSSSKLNYDSLPDHADILLFGPAGSGKSSLIRTFVRGLRGERAEEVMGEDLVIKAKNENEGTTKYTGITVKKGEIMAPKHASFDLDQSSSQQQNKA